MGEGVLTGLPETRGLEFASILLLLPHKEKPHVFLYLDYMFGSQTTVLKLSK